MGSTIQGTNRRAESAVSQKIVRLRRGGFPRVLDLFAGCGGLSLGFQAAGFKIVAAIEFDPLAAQSHALNFFGDHSTTATGVHAKPRDIAATEPAGIVSEFELGPLEGAIDAIIGGPPCQAFARVGRAKLREIAKHPHAFLHDPRGDLFLRYIHYVRELRPVAIVMENVPDVLNYGGHNISEEMCEVLSEFGYVCKYTLLNAAFYGVPQMRERMFLVALAKELEHEVRFPSPDHWVELPKGYEGSRQVALKCVNGNGKNGQFPLFGASARYTPPPSATDDLTAAVTAREALGDLPHITLHLEGKLTRGARRFSEVIPYSTAKDISEYARLMRGWPGFESPVGVRDHVIRRLPRDYQIFRRMNPGDQYPQAFKCALELLSERVVDLRNAGREIVEGTQEYETLKSRIVPPYDPGKFPNKWRKMEADLPARTLMAHLGKDGYSHIHYDGNQARTISVREAARLQSFPDGFMFKGTMNPAFRQIGNAVPPLLALALGRTIIKQLKRA
ncbi:MAG: DNA cytosine methyltransferase [Terriglobia bacterium]